MVEHPPRSNGDEAMIYAQGIEKRLDRIEQQMTDGFANLERKFDAVVPRSEMDIIQRHVEKSIADVAKSTADVADDQEEDRREVAKLRKWIYMFSGGAIGGSVTINQIIERIFL